MAQKPSAFPSSSLDRSPARTSWWKPRPTWVPVIIALASLFTAISAVKTQMIQNAPYLALELVSSGDTVSYHPPGSPATMDTTVTIKNSGNTPAANLVFTTAGWFTSSTEAAFQFQSGTGVKREVNMQETIPWQVSPPADSLDRDQPTNHLFSNFPLETEPKDAVDYLYVEAEYEDTYTWPFRGNHQANFCVVRFPPIATTLRNWQRAPSGDCDNALKVIAMQHKDGPLRPE